MQPTRTSKHVVITGMGVISPLGLDSPTLWGNLVARKAGIRPITIFDTTGFDVKIAGEAKDFDPADYMSPNEARPALVNVVLTNSFGFGGHNVSLVLRACGGQT